jgi:NIMA (never in mitosis gene a)-related kinase
MQNNLPTTKIKPNKPKYFNFPSSPNRTILFSDFLKTKLGEEKFFKIKSILESSSNPIKLLDEQKHVVLEIIG